MAEMRMVPVNMSHQELLALLDDIRARVAEGDSFAGSIEYLIPVDDAAPARSFDVQACYRVGNCAGQGGTRMIGEMREVTSETRTGNCPACWHLWELHGPDGCTCKISAAHSLTGVPCPCEHPKEAAR